MDTEKTIDLLVVGIDPGLKGAVCLLGHFYPSPAIFDAPVFNNHNGKKDYDIPAMVKVLSPFVSRAKRTVVLIEKTHAMPGQGVTSMFTFGRGSGLWEGICHALGCEVFYVTPQTWKKQWPELLVPRMSKDNKPKTVKEKAEAAKMKRQAKEQAKVRARELAATIWPNQSKAFEKVSGDGRAESSLIAKYALLHGKEYHCEDFAW